MGVAAQDGDAQAALQAEVLQEADELQALLCGGRQGWGAGGARVQAGRQAGIMAAEHPASSRRPGWRQRGPTTVPLPACVHVGHPAIPQVV